VDDYENVIVKKYERPFSDDNEIKTGAKVIVRESQRAVFIKGGQLADIFTPGTYKLSTENIPILSTMLALPYMFNYPIKADLYFISLKQFIGNKWETKSPIIVRDKEFNMVRISASGTFAFRITEPDVFMREVLGTQKMYMMQQIVEYLSSYILEVFGVTIGECNIPVIDLPIKYSVISSSIVNKANEKTRMNGIEITNVNVEAIKLPPQVEQYIDEQSGIGMASKHMDEFVQQKAKQDQAYREQMLAKERERKEEVQNKINNGKNMVFTVVGWIVTAFLGLTAISCIIVPPKQGTQHHTYILMGVWLLVLALLACPPISKYTKKFTTYTKYKFVVVIVAVILFFVSLYI
jgi:membrane protease subunit (stomatin/prohibitin family)